MGVGRVAGSLGPRAWRHVLPLPVRGWYLRVLAVACVAFGCDDPAAGPSVNRAPAIMGALPDKVVGVGETATVDASVLFFDPDGDALDYTSSSSDTSVATVSISGSRVAITARAKGASTISITATDPSGTGATRAFRVVVPNRAPVRAGAIPDQTVYMREEAVLNASAHFTDPDGDALSYAASSSDATVAAVAALGSAVTITALGKDTATVTITARDASGLSAAQVFQVMVPNRAPEPVGSLSEKTVYLGQQVTLDAAAYFTDPDGDVLSYAASSSDASVAAVAASGSAVTITALGKDTATVTITARDASGLSAAQVFQVMVPNRAPEPVGSLSEKTVYLGQQVTLDAAAYFTDPDGDVLSYAASSSNATVAAVAASGSAVTITALAKGRATVTITARDASGASAAQVFQVMVPNRAPEPVGSLSEKTVYLGQQVTLDAAAYFTDPDGDVLSYAASSSDATVAAVTASGSAVTITALAKGRATVTMTARDASGASAAQVFQVMVPNRAPELVSAVPDQTLPMAETALLDLSTYFRDPDGDALTYGASSSDSTVAAVSTSGSMITITALRRSTATVTVTGSDPLGLAVTDVFLVVVANRAPVLVGVVPDQSVLVGESALLDVSNYFRDPDGDDLSYGASSSDEAVAAVTASGSAVTITALAEGSVTITITASDASGSVASQHFAVVVLADSDPNQPPRAVGVIADYTLRGGETVTLDAAPYFTDPDGEPLSYGASSSEPTVASATASGSTVAIQALRDGSSTITVTAADAGGRAATQTFQVVVSSTTANRPPRVARVLSDLTLFAGEATTIDVAPYFTDPDGDALTYAVTSSDASVATAKVSGSTVVIAALAEGPTRITVTASDPAGLSASQTVSATVFGTRPNPALFYLVQAVQTRSASVPLVAGIPALLRVFVTTHGTGSGSLPPVRATFYSGGSQIHQMDIASPSATIPQAIDERSLSNSVNADVPGWVIQPGLEVVVEPDPQGTLDKGLGMAPRIPLTGRTPVDVRSMPDLNITLIPVLLESNPDSSVIQTVNAMVADPNGHSLFTDTRRLLPVAGINATAHDPVTTNESGRAEVLSVVRLIRAAERGTGHFMGVITNGPTGGRAEVEGWASWITPYSWVIAHELGHNRSLFHAPCRATTWVDPNYPHRLGTIGAWGYDAGSGRVVHPNHFDFMSYCGPNWVSDYNYAKALRYRARTEPGPAPSAASGVPSLIVWGGLEGEGLPYLRPSFVLDAPPMLPEAEGPWSVSGTDRSGRELFSVSLAMKKVADTGDERAGFAFSLPITWTGELARIRLAGPRGSASLDQDSDLPVTLVRDPVSGRIRGVFSGPPTAAMRPLGAGNVRALQVIFSRGIPDPAANRR